MEIDWFNYALTILALIISMIPIYWKYRDRQYRIKVNLTQKPSSVTKRMKYEVRASNCGNKIVSLNEVKIIVINEKTTQIFPPQPNSEFPCDLKPGKSCTATLSMEELVKMLKGSDKGVSGLGEVKIRGIYVDGLGNEYLSKSKKFDIKDWDDEGNYIH